AQRGAGRLPVRPHPRPGGRAHRRRGPEGRGALPQRVPARGIRPPRDLPSRHPRPGLEPAAGKPRLRRYRHHRGAQQQGRLPFGRGHRQDLHPDPPTGRHPPSGHRPGTGRTLRPPRCRRRPPALPGAVERPGPADGDLLGPHRHRVPAPGDPQRGIRPGEDPRRGALRSPPEPPRIRRTRPALPGPGRGSPRGLRRALRVRRRNGL
ncbi:MAG: hypothetical protein AVDCRST_MAG83-3255, partial [uncultured Arthrobacter sp.]